MVSNEELSEEQWLINVTSCYKSSLHRTHIGIDTEAAMLGVLVKRIAVWEGAGKLAKSEIRLRLSYRVREGHEFAFRRVAYSERTCEQVVLIT